MAWRTLVKLMRGTVDEVSDDIIHAMMKDKYTDNLLGVISTVKKMGFIPTMELMMRSVQGDSIERPLGSHLQLSPWDKLLLNPVHLYRFPTPEKTKIDTKVTIGPRAKKPLQIQIPIFIAGMSYGSALSRKSKVALAKAASMMKTATNTGESSILQEEREAAEKLIGQYNRGGYMHPPEKYKQLDAIEIQFGQGAQGSAPRRQSANYIGEEMREVHGLEKGKDAVIGTRIPGIDSKKDFITTVRKLKDETGVPVGIKLAAGHFLEQELDIAFEAGVDFVSVDGAEGGTHGGEPTLQDDLGLPTLYALARAGRHFQRRGVKGRISLLGGGGLITPGHFLKALGLGCDAVYIGTAAMMALVSEQIINAAPFEPATQMVLYTGRHQDKFDPEKGVQNLVNFLTVCVQEMEAVLYSIGKSSMSELDTTDLCCLDPFLAKAVGVQFAGVAAEEQDNYFQGLPHPAVLSRETTLGYQPEVH